jgi:hypothetical protein
MHQSITALRTRLPRILVFFIYHTPLQAGGEVLHSQTGCPSFAGVALWRDLSIETHPLLLLARVSCFYLVVIVICLYGSVLVQLGATRIAAAVRFLNAYLQALLHGYKYINCAASWTAN